MTPLITDLRKILENTIPIVRDHAEQAADALLTTYAVNRADPFPGMDENQRRIRNGLRARARQLGNGVMAEGLDLLKSEIAYEQWHRMVFARFLAENGLLRHPSGVAINLQDCTELAAEEGEADAWAVAAKYASLMLPGIFLPEDPAVQLRLSPEGRNSLESMLKSFPDAVFTADDSLGWMYQFWQSKKKEEINRSERKIGGADIAPVTQLFTEDYMVRFLLENSLGAWWAGKHPNSPLVKTWEYLRLKEDGTPAAGTFPGWPNTAAEVTLMDPCCGSGHFLVAGFNMLVRMRMEEESLGEAESADAVLRDNLFGLEIDPRCTQIAAFALALAAWKYGGYRSLPIPNIACSGIPVQGQLETWLKLAGKDSRLQAALEVLYKLFSDAPDLGSLINPSDLPQNELFTAEYNEVAPLLEKALKNKFEAEDLVSAIFGETVESVAKATQILAGKYILVATNVPYLTSNKQSDILKSFCVENYPKSKADLATVFIERCRDFTSLKGAYCLVSPQNWVFLGSYKKIRESLLQDQTWNNVSLLGSGSTATASWEKLRALTIITNYKSEVNNQLSGLNAFFPTDDQKADWLKNGELLFGNQASLLQIPDARIMLEGLGSGSLLSEYADAYQGIVTADKSRFVRCFWEIDQITSNTRWICFQTSFGKTGDFLGRQNILDLINLEKWNSIHGSARLQGDSAFLKWGVAVNQMRTLPVTIYSGDKFDANAHVIIPKDEQNLPAIYCFCQSKTFSESIRKIDQKIGVTTATLVKIPFNLEYWKKIAERKYPSGLPEPYSDDPTQWLFQGNPILSTAPLQVAIARLLGYHWPQQVKDDLEKLVDHDGIVCLPSVAGEASLIERLRGLLIKVFGNKWEPESTEIELLSKTGATGKSLSEWLMGDFFIQHCRLFHNRPFIWHIWDGRKDGFSALVNYHKLDSANLDKLIFTYLGDWIRFQRARRDHGEPGADGRLVAALELEKKLKAIKEGEPPYDIYVRWKPLSQQSLGWNPDLNDGVRLNIRPFVSAGVLRSRFTINWNKDRGKNPDGSERMNDLHYRLVEKQSARETS